MKTKNLLQRFVSSLSFDIRLAPYDIKGSKAHARMLAAQKIIPGWAADKIVKGLDSISRDLQKGTCALQGEDIHLALEKELIRRVGKAGMMLHTARSRNDQVITDLYLYLKDEVGSILSGLKNYQKALLSQAKKNSTVVMPGFTHLQHAQPVLLAHHLLSYAWMAERDKGRFTDLIKRLDVLPLGSAALGGTSFPIDRSMVARLLGFKTVSENSIDATASRDTILEFLSSAAITMTNLSRLAEEIVIWTSSEFSFVELHPDYTTGSSIMPQKQNPDLAELVRGKTGRVIGNLTAGLVMVKGLPLAYNRDLQEDKPPVFDSADVLRDALGVMEGMVSSLKVHEERIAASMKEGFLAATELADYLTRRGVPFRAAHGVIKNVVAYCQKKGRTLEDLTLPELKKFHSKFDESALRCLTPDDVVKAKTSAGGTSPSSVRRQIQQLEKLT